MEFLILKENKENTMKTGYVIGKTGTRFLNVSNQSEPYITSEYLVIKDALQGDILAEVIETSILPCVDDSLLPEGCITTFLEKLGFELSKPVFFSKVKILKDLSYPIMPNSEVIPAKYEEISSIISKAKKEDSMVIGIIKGTEHSQKELPKELSNISPLWENGQAIHQKGIPFLLNHHAFREYPHLGLFGSSGSGKSFAMRTILEELMKLRVPALCFDPHYEMKFEGLMKGLGNEFQIDYHNRYEEFVIGKNVGIQFSDLSTLELISLFEFIDGLTEPQRNALEILYEKGDTFEHLQNKINELKNAFELMDSFKSNPKNGYPNLTPLQKELYNTCKDRISGASTLQALGWKCVSLKNTEIFNNNTNGVQAAIRNGKLAIIQGDITRLKMISAYLINKLYQKRRFYIDKDGDFFPPFFIIADEAHNFAPETGKNTPTRSVLRKIGQEARKYGVFLGLSTQRPCNLDSTLLAQLNTKFIFRLNNETDMNVARIEGNLTQLQTSTLPDLSSGNCFISSAILTKTYPIRFRTTFSKAPNVLDPFNELNEMFSYTENELEDILMNYLPIDSMKLGKKIPEIANQLGKTLSTKELIDVLDELARKGMITKTKIPGIGVKYEK